MPQGGVADAEGDWMSVQNDDPRFVPAGYHIEQPLGSGQTSNVFLATHAEFGRVALKLPRPELQARPVLRRMFENEVQITVKLDHDNVVSAYDGFPTGAGAFLALQFCPGGTLDQLLLERGRLAKERAYALVIDVAEGLSYTHERSVLHRDVKPANVFLTSDGRAKLGDFGTGIFLAEDSTERVGTAFYMAPEIFEGAKASKRSDIYSLGVLAYEVLSGERPVVGDSYDSLMLGHLTGIPRDLMVVRPDLSRNVVRVVTMAMSRNPEKRFATVVDFVRAFRHATGQTPTTGASAPQPTPPLTTGRASRKASTPAEDDQPTPNQGGGLFGWFKRRRD